MKQSFSENKILGIQIPTESKSDILDNILKDIDKKRKLIHIVSLNPENIIIAQKNLKFKKALNEAEIQLVDGMGIVLASRLLRINHGERYGGVDLMSDLIKIASNQRLRVMLIGGRPKLADELAKCYKNQYPEADFLGITGISNIKKPKKTEEKSIFSIVGDYKPHLIFLAFGSPYQELWIEQNRNQLSKAVYMGVGGGFDFLGNEVKRAPVWMRNIGLEWLYRLIVQPWRIKRQLRLLKFVWLVLNQKWNEN